MFLNFNYALWNLYFGKLIFPLNKPISGTYTCIQAHIYAQNVLEKHHFGGMYLGRKNSKISLVFLYVLKSFSDYTKQALVYSVMHTLDCETK